MKNTILYHMIQNTLRYIFESCDKTLKILYHMIQNDILLDSISYCIILWYTLHMMQYHGNRNHMIYHIPYLQSHPLSKFEWGRTRFSKHLVNWDQALYVKLNPFVSNPNLDELWKFVWTFSPNIQTCFELIKKHLPCPNIQIIKINFCIWRYLYINNIYQYIMCNSDWVWTGFTS